MVVAFRRHWSRLFNPPATEEYRVSTSSSPAIRLKDWDSAGLSVCEAVFDREGEGAWLRS